MVPTDNSGMIDLTGISAPASELPIPSIRLVHPTSSNIVTASGGDAKVGHFYNNSSKIAYEKPEFRVLHLAKGSVKDFNDPEKTVPAYSIVGYHLEPQEVFFMVIKGSDYWGFRNSVFPVLVNGAKEGSVYDPTITAVSKKISNKDNIEYLVADYAPDITKKPTEKESQILKLLQSKYGPYAIQRSNMDEVEIVEADKKVNEDVDPSEFPL